MLSRRSFLGRAAALAAATGLVASATKVEAVPVRTESNQGDFDQGDFVYYQSVEPLEIGDHVVMDNRDMMRIRKQRSRREKIHGVCVNFDPRGKIALVRVA